MLLLSLDEETGGCGVKAGLRGCTSGRNGRPGPTAVSAVEEASRRGLVLVPASSVQAMITSGPPVMLCRVTVSLPMN